jgi:hypothetical protein
MTMAVQVTAGGKKRGGSQATAMRSMAQQAGGLALGVAACMPILNLAQSLGKALQLAAMTTLLAEKAAEQGGMQLKQAPPPTKMGGKSRGITQRLQMALLEGLLPSTASTAT